MRNRMQTPTINASSFARMRRLSKRHLGLRDEDIVGKERFCTWMRNYVDKAHNKKHDTLKALIALHSRPKLIELLYQEFRILSGYDKDAYAPSEGTSTLASLFADKEARLWIKKAYQDYLDCLKART